MYERLRNNITTHFPHTRKQVLNTFLKTLSNKDWKPKMSWQRKLFNITTNQNLPQLKKYIKQYHLRKNISKATEWYEDEDPIHHACLDGLNVFLEVFLQQKAKINAFSIGTHWKCTLLHCAVFGGHVKTVDILIQRGADVNIHGYWS